MSQVEGDVVSDTILPSNQLPVENAETLEEQDDGSVQKKTNTEVATTEVSVLGGSEKAKVCEDEGEEELHDVPEHWKKNKKSRNSSKRNKHSKNGKNGNNGKKKRNRNSKGHRNGKKSKSGDRKKKSHRKPAIEEDEATEAINSYFSSSRYNQRKHSDSDSDNDFDVIEDEALDITNRVLKIQNSLKRYV